MACLLGAAAMCAQEPAARAWTTADSLAMTYFASEKTYPGSWWDSGNPQTIDPSPDGKWFFLITSGVDAATDELKYALYLFRTDEIRQALAGQQQAAPTEVFNFHGPDPRKTFDMGLICQARWTADSKAILFKSPDSAGYFQVNRIDLTELKVSQLTNEPYGVAGNVSGDSKFILYRPKRGPELPDWDYPFVRVTNDAGVVKTTPRKPFNLESMSRIYLSAAGRKELKHLPIAAEMFMMFSPDGRFGITRSYVKGTNQFEVFDLTADATLPALSLEMANLPASFTISAGKLPAQAFWTADSHHAILVNAVPPGYSLRSNGMGVIVHLDLRTQTYEVIADLSGLEEECGAGVQAVEWDQAAEQLSVQMAATKDEQTTITYQFDHGAWARRAQGGPARPPALEAGKTVTLGGIVLQIRESTNSRARLYASDSTHELLLMDPNSWLDQVAWVPAERFTWTEATGGAGKPRTAQGLLRVPPQVRGPVPLMIYVQWGPVEKFDSFLPDGVTPSSGSVQTLVRRGIAVLQVMYQDLPKGRDGADREGFAFAERVNGILAQLSRDRRIDTTSVAAMGFSRGGMQPLFGAMHAKPPGLKAAIVVDSFIGDFDCYLYVGAQGDDFRPEYDAPTGGAFWDRKAEWLDWEPFFNLDRLRAPVLFTVHHGMDNGVLWDLYGTDSRQLHTGFVRRAGAFRLAHRPTEFVLFPSGNHNLQSPKERAAAIELFADWTCFWLKGGTPKDPVSAARWVILRKQQDEVLKTPPPPKGKWVFQPDAEQPAWTPPPE